MSDIDKERVALIKEQLGGEKRPPEISKNTLYCTFCGKSQHEVRRLIAAPTVFICNECVEVCADIIKEETKPPQTNEANPAAIDGVCQHQRLTFHSGGYYVGCMDCHVMWAFTLTGQAEYGVGIEDKPIGARLTFVPTMKFYNDERDTRVAPTKP